jgi:hypothetical protein
LAYSPNDAATSGLLINSRMATSPRDLNAAMLNHRLAYDKLKDDPIANQDLIDALTLGPVEGEEKVERLITIKNVDLVERFLLNETVDGRNMEEYKTVYPIYFQISTFR